MSITLALDSKVLHGKPVLSLASALRIILPQKSAILQYYFFLFDIHPSCLSLTVLFPPNPNSVISGQVADYLNNSPTDKLAAIYLQL